MNVINELFDLSSKTSIITGASRGIGAEIARTLARAGSNIAIIYHNYLEGAKIVKNEIKKLEKKVDIFQADVSDSDQVKKMVEKVYNQFGRIDILINNVGVYPHSFALEMKEEEWDKVINVNLKSAFLCSREVAKYMIESKEGGKIVNISSISHLQPEMAFSHYCASKGGLVSLTRSLALEWAQYKINVNAILPGLIDTGELGKNALYRMNAYLKLCPLKRVGIPSDIANTVLFLVSKASNFITGQTIIVDGGVLLAGYMNIA